MNVKFAAMSFNLLCRQAVALKSSQRYDVIVTKIVGAILKKSPRLFLDHDFHKIAGHVVITINTPGTLSPDTIC